MLDSPATPRDAAALAGIVSKPAERRATVYRGVGEASLVIAIWLAPLPEPSTDVHVLVRVDETTASADR